VGEGYGREIGEAIVVGGGGMAFLIFVLETWFGFGNGIGIWELG